MDMSGHAAVAFCFCTMREVPTLEHIAGIVIRRTIEIAGRGPELAKALERAYPFPEGRPYRDAWRRSLQREGIRGEALSARRRIRTHSVANSAERRNP
jgi:hypothetical protein